VDDHVFVSYSRVDGSEFVLGLVDPLTAGPPPFSVWFDQRKLRPGEAWDRQLVEAIRGCRAALFVMTRDSVLDSSVCKREWVRALKYKKPVIPLLIDPEAELPFQLEPRQYIDFTDSFEEGLARLRQHLAWMDSPEGVLQALVERLEDAERELPRARDQAQQARTARELEELRRQIAEQRQLLADPHAASQHTQQRIASGLERERAPERPVVVRRAKFVNPPPVIAPTWFQDRHVETEMVGDFLNDDGLRLLTVVGRGGVGKTAMICRLLKALEGGQLPDDLGPLEVDGIVYLSPIGTHKVTFPNLFADLTRLLPEEKAQRLDQLYQDPQHSPRDQTLALLEAFPGGRTVLLLDNFEDVVDPQTLGVADAELDEALQTVLSAPGHGVKVILTTRVAPHELLLVQPARQQRLNLDEGLPSPYAENILRAMDRDGTLGLATATDAQLAEARERTRGYPRALKLWLPSWPPTATPPCPSCWPKPTSCCPRTWSRRWSGRRSTGLTPWPSRSCRPWPSTACRSPRWRWTTCCTPTYWPSTAPRSWADWSTCSSYAVTPAATTYTRSTATTPSAASHPANQPIARALSGRSAAMHCWPAVPSTSSRPARHESPGKS